jgi:hypothetical protein
VSKNSDDDLERRLRAMIPDASVALIDRRELDEFKASNPTDEQVEAWAQKKISEGVELRKRIQDG